jgi:cell division protein FtsI/penicillin-binding protein 2
MRPALKRRSLLLCWHPMVCTFLLLLGMTCAALAQAPLRTIEGSVFAKHQGTLVLLDLQSNKILFSHHLSDAAHHATVTGSTLKPLLLLTLLQEGRIDPRAEIACVRAQHIRGELVRCTHPEEVRSVEAEGAVVWSCNSYFERAVERFHEGEVERVLSGYGLTSPTGLVPGEARGSIAPARDVGSRQLLALGLEGIRTTPLELLEAYRRLAQELQQRTPAASVTRDALVHGVDYGMASPARSQKVRIAGKTGTAVNGNASVGWFAGFAPADAPRVAVVVRLNGARGTDAAGVAKQIVEAWLDSQR